jgi:hypothetical protein
MTGSGLLMANRTSRSSTSGIDEISVRLVPLDDLLDDFADTDGPNSGSGVLLTLRVRGAWPSGAERVAPSKLPLFCPFSGLISRLDPVICWLGSADDALGEGPPPGLTGGPRTEDSTSRWDIVALSSFTDRTNTGASKCD